MTLVVDAGLRRRHGVRVSAFFVVVSIVSLAVMPANIVASGRALILLGYPTFVQQHELSCEASATSMATRGVVTEDQIIARTPASEDPNLGYRGNPNGPYILGRLPNYGVYPSPLVSVLQSYGWHAVAIHHATRYGLKRYLRLGWPVVVWITDNVDVETPFWLHADGHRFRMVPFEHAVLAVGYGSTGIIVNNPADGARETYDWKEFTRSWSYLGRMALAVEPCAAPAAVTNLKGVRDDRRITWTWSPVAGARRYRAWIFQRRGGRWKFIKHRLLMGTTVLARGSVETDAYRIRVAAVAPCGVLGAAAYSLAPGVSSAPSVARQ